MRVTAPRPPQPPPVPAAALPGRDRRPLARRHRLADPARSSAAGNTTVLLAEATAIDPERKPRARSRDGEHRLRPPDRRHRRHPLYFGHDDWAPLRARAEDPRRTRSRSAAACSSPSRRPSARPTPGARRRWLTFVVVGGGPTGVEMAGAFAEIARHTLPGDFRHIDPRDGARGPGRGGPAHPRRPTRPISPPGPPGSSRRLASRSGRAPRVTDVTRRASRVGGERLAAGTVVWAAGVEALAARPLARRCRSTAPAAWRSRRISPCPGRPEITVIGDLAAIESGGRPVPGVAPAAMQMGRHAAANVVRALARRTAPARSATATRARSRPSAARGRWPSSGG